MSHLAPELIETVARSESAAPADAKAHLASCAECRQAVSDARGRQKLLGGMKPYTLSDMAFRRVEARLMSEVEQGIPARGFRWWWFVPAAVAVALAAFIAVQFPEDGPRILTLPTPKSVGGERVAFYPLTVIRSSGDAQVRAGAEWKQLVPGDVLREGDAVSAERVVIAPETDVKWVFEAKGAVAVGGIATVNVGAGEVVAYVGKPADVIAGTRRVIAAEALFAVSHAAAEVVLDVAQGSVDVVDTATAERRTFKAPVRMRWVDGSPLSSGREEPARALAAPELPSRPWVRFDASSLPIGTAISLDGAMLGEAPLSLLLSQGRHHLGLTPPGQPTQESWIDLTGNAFVPTFVAAAPKELDDGAIARLQAELQRQRPKLAACYEKWLKANPTAGGKVDLLLVVAADGRVRSAKVKGEPMSQASADCVVQTATKLVLPALGSEQEIEVPLVFTPGSR